MDIRFEHSDLLYGLWALLPLLILLLHARNRRRRAAERLLDGAMRRRLLPQGSGLRSFVPSMLILLGFASLVLAASRPRFGVFYEKVSQRGADLVVLLDVSRSMLSEDVYPSRLERSKDYIRDLLAEVRGDRVGLVVFAGKAVPACPLTTDHAFFESILAEVGPHSAPRGGTVIGDAIREATRALDTLPDRDQAFLLITDGEDQDSFPLEAAAAAAGLGVKIFCVGIGDPEQGARIPLSASDASTGFVKHEGQEVWSRMDEELLRNIALETGGAYVPVRTGTYDLGQVYQEHLAGLRGGALDDQERRRFREQYQSFAALGLALWLVALLFNPYRRGAPRLSAGLLLSGFLLAPSAQAAESGVPEKAARLHNQGLEQFQSGELDRALELFKEAEELSPDQPRIHLGQGAALQQQGQLDAAADQYLQASSKGDKSATAVARYNLGTIAAERARKLLGDQPEEAQGETRTQSVQEIDGAILHFRATLRLDPAHAAARHNLELLRLWLKHIQDAWKQRDERQQAQEQDLPALLLEFLKEQETLRDELLALRPEAPSPRRDEALAQLGDRQGHLAGRLDELPPKVEQTLEQLFQAQSGPGAAGQGDEAAKRLEQAREQILSLVEATQAEMRRAEDALRNALPDAAAEPQKVASDQLEALWTGFANFPQVLRRALELEQGLVAETAPLVEALPGAAPAEPFRAEAMAEQQGRVGALAPWLLDRAESSLTAAAEAREAKEAKEAEEAEPAPSKGPPGEEDQELDEEQKAQLQEQRERMEAEVAAFEKALENLPLIPDLSKRAAANLEQEDYPGALPDEEEILRLLREISELWPKDDESQQGPSQEENQGDQEKDPEEQPDQQDQQDQPDQDQQDQQDQSESKQQDQPLTKEQVEELLQKALEREQEYKQKKRELERMLLVPVPVERDW